MRRLSRAEKPKATAVQLNPEQNAHVPLSQNPKQFHKVNTIDNIFNSYYGFQSGSLLIEGIAHHRHFQINKNSN
jgi:hypothetical protein